jgi:hypothetical protein
MIKNNEVKKITHYLSEDFVIDDEEDQVMNKVMLKV